MAGSDNPFIYYTALEITTLLAQAKVCLSEIMTAGRSYAINGRQFTRADMREVKDMVMQLVLAQEYQAGRDRSFARPVFNRGYW